MEGRIETAVEDASVDAVALRDLRLRAALTNHLFDHHRGLHLMTIAAVVLIAAFFSRVADAAAAFAWAGMLISIELVRMVLAHRFYHRVIPLAETKLWARRFRIGVYAAGAAWGLAGIMLFPTGVPLFQILMGMILVSVAAITVPILAGSFRACLPFILLLLLPIAIRFLATAEPMGYVAGGLVLVGAGILTMIAQRAHELTVLAFRQQITYSEQVRALEREMAERRAAEERARDLAYFDQLTRLPNQAQMLEDLDQAMRRADTAGDRVALLLLDMDRFKHLNDSFGSEGGDYVLKLIARRLREHLGERATVARMSGRDEFAVIIEDYGSGGELTKISERLLLAITRPITYEQHELALAASMGMARFPEDARNPNDLLRCADIAMHQAKSLGRQRICTYDPASEHDARERLLQENALRKGLERQEFVLHFQPLIDTRSGRVAGYEALVRWRHPEDGLMMPDNFIPLAEESGLIVPLGEWVLREACHYAVAWQHRHAEPVHIAVNVSLRQFADGDLAQTVARALAETGLQPELLFLEITESVAMVDREQNAAVLNEIKKLGVRLALDDFGTGNSSLSHLKYLPVDVLKIDREFAHDLDTDSHDAAIARATITLARSLGMGVIAEGVEKPEQITWLSNEGCDLMQGYYFGRPLPADECEATLDDLVKRLAMPSRETH